MVADKTLENNCSDKLVPVSNVRNDNAIWGSRVSTTCPHGVD